MKVLFITRKFPPSKGGMEVFAHDLSRALEAKVDLRLVAWGGTGRLRAILWAVPLLTLRSFWHLATKPIDIVHAQDGVMAPTAYLLSKLFHKPYVVVVHGLDLTFGNPLFRAIVPPAVRRAQTVICISQAAADEALRIGVPGDRIKIIPLAVADRYYGKSDRAHLLREYKLPADSQLLLTTGRLVPRKGAAWFIRHVLPQLTERYKKLVYIVAGEGVDRQNIESAISDTGLQAHVCLTGMFSEEQAAMLYGGADLFIMPNINVPNDVEGFGLVLLDASLAALPVVAANTEGIKDAVVANKNGILVPVGDSEAYVKAIGHFLDDPARRSKFGSASRAFSLATYQWGPISDRYVEIYKKLCS